MTWGSTAIVDVYEGVIHYNLHNLYCFFHIGEVHNCSKIVGFFLSLCFCTNTNTEKRLVADDSENNISLYGNKKKLHASRNIILKSHCMHVRESLIISVG